MEEVSIKSSVIFNLFGFPITNTIIAAWVGMAVLIIIAAVFYFTLQSKPRGFQNVVEWVMESLMGLVDSITNNREITKKIFPFVMTIFLFILLNNWIGLFPGLSAIEIIDNGHVVPVFRSANADLNTTLALAVIAMITVQIFGILAIGILPYLKKYINFKSPVDFFVGILEIISELSKILSLSFRLFGNVFAGEVLLIVIGFLVPYILPMPFYGMEVFVGFIQALVFTMLTAVFMTMAAQSHEAH